MGTVVETLFPVHRTVNWLNMTCLEVIHDVKEEVTRVVKRLKSGKAQGPDGSPAEVVKAMVTDHTEPMRRLMDDPLQAGEFSKKWKITRLMLLRIGDKQKDLPSSYRPLCLLDAAAKLREQIVLGRSQKQIKEASARVRNAFDSAL